MDALSTKVTGLDPGPSPAEKRDLLARLLARLAHEIRNPLSSLDIHVQLLEEDLAQTAPETRQRLEIIRGELNRLENIVRRFLRLASPSALEIEAVDLARIVSHVTKLLRPEASARQVKLATSVAPDLPILQADGGQLTQAVLNLVINALQAVGTGGCVCLRVTVAPEQEIRLEVQDTGPGVPPERLGEVFEPYFTTKEEGSGLGLWIAQQIAVAHGGTLEVRNAAEGGAVFCLRLPLLKPGSGDG